MISKLARTRLGYAVGCLTAAVGVAVQFGLGAGLMAGGTVCAASFLLLADVEEG